MSLLRRFIPSLQSSVRFASSGRLYTKKHEWVLVENGVGTVGITDFAADQLGDVVYIELPEEGAEITRGDSTGAVESVKAASDIYAPISGTVTAKNAKLEEEAGLINKSPFDKGWLYKLEVKSTEELSKLLSEQQYEQFKKDAESEH